MYCDCTSMYTVHTLLWQFGCGMPCLGSLTIEETLDKQDFASKASDKRQKETCEGLKGDGFLLEMSVSVICMSMNSYTQVCSEYVLCTYWYIL